MDAVPGLANLPEKDKQELQAFVVNESQKARIQHSVHNLTNTCWTKCVTGKISSGKLERGEESCMMNCVDRFMDAHLTALRHLDALREKS